jgi:hypothetical protein
MVYRTSNIKPYKVVTLINKYVYKEHNRDVYELIR